MKIWMQITLAVSAIAVASIIVVILSLAGIRSVGSKAVEMYDGPLMSISFARSAYANAILVERLLGDVTSGAAQAEDAADLLDDLLTDVDIVQERSKSEKTVELAEVAVSDVEALIELLEADDTLLTNDILTRAANLRSEIAGLVDTEAEFGYLARQQVQENVDGLLRTNTMITVICLGLGALVSSFIAWRVSRSIRRVSAAMELVAEDVLDTDIPFRKRRDEVGQMARQLEQFRQNALEHLDAANQISSVAAACSRGNFSQRLDTTGKSGVFLELCQGINAIGDTTEKGLADIRELSDALAAGALVHRMPSDQEGIFGEIATSFNQSMEQLAHTVQRIQTTAESLKSTSAGMSDTSNGLMHAMQEQARMLGSSSDRLNKVVESVQESSASAQTAGEIAMQSSNVARRGNGIVELAVASMQRISDTSSRISKINKAIEELARQTNLLALNAAVEAARAGEAGSGFSVVAGEVRTLAHNSSSESEEIRRQINNSVEEIKNGVEHVQNSGLALAEIVDMAQKVADLVENVARSSGALSVEMIEVNSDVGNVGQLVTENSRLANSTHEASGHIARLGEELVGLMAFFTTKTQEGTGWDEDTPLAS